MTTLRQLIVSTRVDENVGVNKKEKKVIRIEVTEGAKSSIKAFADEMDMTDIGVSSRLYEWFGRQPKIIKKWVAGLLEGGDDAGAREFASAILEDFERGGKRLRGSIHKGDDIKRIP